MTTSDASPTSAFADEQLMIDHVNTNHDDSLLLLARVLGDRRTATAARVVGVDGEGFDLVVTVDGAQHAARVAFAEAAADLAQVSTQARALVQRARALSGEEGETSIERDISRMRSIRTFITSVSAVEDVHPHLRKITFAGGDLATFEPLGPDTFLYVLLPPSGRTELPFDQSFSWDEWQQTPEDERATGAYYTLRAWRPDVAELDMLFVLHDPSGPASEWAARAQPGDPVGLWGPREAFEPPADTNELVLVADDTGLPAVAAIVEWAPTYWRVHVVAEVDSPAEQQPIPHRDGVKVQWVHRNGRAAGVDATPMLDALRSIALTNDRVYVWGAGESRAMTAVRTYARRELGLPRERVSLVAYWRHATSTLDDDLD
ncbi:MAG: SIP domain-containing protein [Actinobacteria bacterium]|nr:SIP domain-containing protein [Actinomycetota bacterium]